MLAELQINRESTERVSRGVLGVSVYGHYPPPVTGERLCTLHLIDRLRSKGMSVDALTKRDGLSAVSRHRNAWIILGSERVGFLRDCIIALRQSRLKRLYVYIHNSSWRRLVRFAGLLRPLFGPRTVLIVLTEEIASRLRSAGWDARVLRNTVTARELEGLRADAAVKRLIWMAAVTAEKGFPLAYAAFLRLREKDARWIFDVYGTGMETAAFSKARFHGVVQGDGKRTAFAQGGILILPSNYINETQPLCLLEALSVGLPVVASRVGGIPEIVGEGANAAGVCVYPIAGDAIASAIETVSNRAAIYGAAARARFEQLFSPEAFDRSLHEITEEEGR